MNDMANRDEIYALYADVLTYPMRLPTTAIDKLKTLLSTHTNDVKTGPNAFSSFIHDCPCSRLQEIYTSTFDLQVVCFPYVGYQLFGESYKRGTFMVKILEFYKQHHFDFDKKELPDFIGVMLRFIGQLTDAELLFNLLNECMIPALEKMLKNFTSTANPYLALLQSLLGFMRLHRSASVFAATLS